MGAPYSSSFSGSPRAVEFGFMPNPALEVPSGLHTLACDQRDSLLSDDGVLNRLDIDTCFSQMMAKESLQS